MEAVHIDERPWETLRWPGQWSKMPTTGGRPIYDGRFNMTARKPVAEENLER
jgi:hypothetical protein